MSVATGRTTFIANEAIPSGRRVKYVGNRRVALAAATDQEIGVSGEQVTLAAIGTPVEVILFNEPGTREVTASGAITDGAAVYRDAAGKITATAAGARYGIALEAATADGDKIEVLPSRKGAGTGDITLGNTNGEIGGLTISASPSQAEVTALRDKCEELADDVRALATLILG